MSKTKSIQSRGVLVSRRRNRYRKPKCVDVCKEKEIKKKRNKERKKESEKERKKVTKKERK